jgi:hypothetical protein
MLPCGFVLSSAGVLGMGVPRNVALTMNPASVVLLSILISSLPYLVVDALLTHVTGGGNASFDMETTDQLPTWNCLHQSWSPRTPPTLLWFGIWVNPRRRYQGAIARGGNCEGESH